MPAFQFRTLKKTLTLTMLSKKNRLPGHLIPDVLNSKKTLHSPHLVLKLINMVGPCQAAFIVSVKIHKKAVDRNRLKRQLKAAFHSHLKNLKKDYAMVFLAKHPVKKVDYKTLKISLSSLLKKAELFTNEKTNPKKL